MATLFRRQNEIWYIVYQDRNRRRWVSTRTRCLGKAVGFLRVSKIGAREVQEDSMSTLSEEVLKYVATNHSVGTYTVYRSALQQFVTAKGDMSLRLLSLRDVEDFKRIRLESVSRVTVNKDIRTLRAAFNLAVAWGMIRTNPFKQSRLLTTAGIDQTFLTHAESERLLGVIKDPMYAAIVKVGLFAMLRRSEIINLQWQDVDLKRGVIRIRNKPGFIVKGRRPRTVPMSRMLVDTFRTMNRRGDYVFCDKSGRQFVGGSVSRRFKYYALQAGLDGSVHLHTLRHTGASWLVQNGVSLYIVQKILGHSSPTATEIYAHVGEEHLRIAIEKLVPEGSPAFALPYDLTICRN